MKKVNSNVKLNMYNEAGNVNHYEGIVKLGEIETNFLVDVQGRDVYTVILEADASKQFDVEGHTMPVSFLYLESEEKKVAKVVRYALAMLLWGEKPGLHHISPNPYELAIGMEYGIDDKVVFYNILTDRTSKRRV